MNSKSKLTKKILMDTIIPEDCLNIIINELNENDERAINYKYLEKLKITFGKHRDKTFGYLVRNEPCYCLWIVKNNINPHNKITKDLKNYLQKEGNNYKKMKYKNHYKKKYYY